MLLSLCLLLLGSCRQGSKNDWALLHEASLHTAQPDSVMDLLGQIARPDRLQGKARADYALLYTEALNKQDRIGTNDSLIRIALDYYSKEAPGIPLAKSYFLLGRICQQQGNDTLALKVNLQALAALPSQTQDRTRMLVNYDLGYLYHQKGFYRQALLHYREMQKYVDAHPDTLDCYITAYSMGNIFMLLNRYDSAYHYYQGAIVLARQLKNESYERYILRQLNLHARLTGNQVQAQWYAEELRATTDPYLKAESFQELGNTDSASFYFLKATKDPQISTRAMAFQNLSQLYRKAHPDLAFVYADSFQIYKDSFYALRQTDKIERLTAAYRQEIDLQKEEADRRENAIYLWGGIGITLLLCGTGVFFFMLLNRYDSAYHYYQGAIVLARQLKNESYERYILRQLNLHARLTGNQVQAQWYAEELRATTDPYLKAESFQELGNTDSASFYFLKATKDPQISTRAMAFQNLSQLYRKAHPDLAFVYADSFQIYKDSFYALRQTDKIERLTAAYRQEIDLQKEEADRRENAIYLWGGIGITLLLCGTGVFFFVQRKKRRYLLLEKQLVANRLAAIKEYVAEQNRRNPEEWSAMYQEIAAIEMQTLIGQFQQTAWQKRIHAIQKGNGKPFSKKEQEAFQKETLALFDEPVKRLQVEYPQITEADLLFCLLSFMDYPTSLIASCTGRKENALRTCKHRLKEKLSKEIFGFFFHFTNNQQDAE